MAATYQPPCVCPASGIEVPPGAGVPAPIMGRRLTRPNDGGLGQFLVLIGFGMFAAFMLAVAFG
jgi:hypothetical protein